MQRFGGAVPAALAGLAALTVAGAVQAQERHVLAEQDVAIYNLVGSIRVEAGSSAETEVQVMRHGGDASNLRVETGRIRGRQTLRVIYPSDRIVFRDGGANRWSGNSRSTVNVADDGTFGDLDGRGDRRVEIRSSGTGMDAYADLVVRLPRGRSLAVFLMAGEASVTNVEGNIHVDVGAARVTTRGTRGRLELDTGAGDVSVTDADGELTLDSGSGDVTLTRVRGPVVRLDTGSGAVQASDVQAEQVIVDTGSGRVALRDVRSPDIELDTGSGSVELMLLADVERLRVDSGSGGITIGVPDSLGAMIDVSTGSGGVDFDFPVTVTRSGRRNFSGQLGDGRGRIDVETGSGSIRFRRP